MVDAVLTGAQLQGAKLQGAYFGTAWLGDAILQDAELQDTQLYSADLQGAALAGTNLQGANLFQANLVGVDLRNAVGLSQAQLETALGDQTTQVPDFLEQPEAWSMTMEAQRLRLSQLPWISLENTLGYDRVA